MKQLAKEAEGLDPNGNDFKSKEAKLTELKAELEAKKEQSQVEFARREAEALGTIYKEIQEMTALVARHYGYNYIVRVNNEPLSAADPNVVLSAINRPVVYADPKSDITEMVLLNLNTRYDRLTAAGAASPGASSPVTPKSSSTTKK
jgi:Skp family chaperone for outer membrane proteins